MKITHSWSECDAPLVPGVPAQVLYPPDAGKASGTHITLHFDHIVRDKSSLHRAFAVAGDVRTGVFRQGMKWRWRVLFQRFQ